MEKKFTLKRMSGQSSLGYPRDGRRKLYGGAFREILPGERVEGCTKS